MKTFIFICDLHLGHCSGSTSNTRLVHSAHSGDSLFQDYVSSRAALTGLPIKSSVDVPRALPLNGSMGSLLKGTGIVSALTVVSRILGFVRDMLTAQLFGAGLLADAYFVALK